MTFGPIEVFFFFFYQFSIPQEYLPKGGRTMPLHMTSDQYDDRQFMMIFSVVFLVGVVMLMIVFVGYYALLYKRMDECSRTKRNCIRIRSSDDNDDDDDDDDDDESNNSSSCDSSFSSEWANEQCSSSSDGDVQNTNNHVHAVCRPMNKLKKPMASGWDSHYNRPYQSTSN